MQKYTELLIIALFIAAIIQGSLLVVSFGNSLKQVEESKAIKTLKNPREMSILSQLMDETIGACYYYTYQQNDTITPNNGDICNKMMSFNKELCKNFLSLGSCKSQYLKEYLKNMEG